MWEVLHSHGRTHAARRPHDGRGAGPALRQKEEDVVRPERTNLPVERLSLNRSQCGGCSTKYDTPTEN